jgi:cell division transport system permease protein
MLTSFKRVLKAGWKNIIRNPWLTTATIFIMAMVITVITALFVGRAMTNQLIGELQDKVDVSVFFQTDVSEKEILKARDEISQLSGVKEITYVTSEEALQIFKDRHKTNQMLLETLNEIGDNPFPASLAIKVEEASQYENLVSYLEGSSFQALIEKIDYLEKKSIIDKLFSISSDLNTGGIVFSLILAFLSVLVAFNTIRLAIYNSREEISVQRLVGASNWFIRGPYVIQGAISGFFASILCFLLLWGISFFLGPKLELIYPTFSLMGFFSQNAFLIFGIQLLTGVGLGVISSIIAIRKYLRV